MKLRRFVRNVLDRDHAADFGEILLVIVGVLTAINFDSWFQELEEREEEQVYLERLSNDMANSLKTYDRYIAFNKSRAIDSLKTAKIIESGKIPSGEEDFFRKALVLAAWRGGGFIPSTYDELFATGHILYIQDSILRDQLASIGFTIARTDGGVERLGDAAQTLYALRSSIVHLTWDEDGLVATGDLSQYLGNQDLADIYFQLAYLYDEMASFQNLARVKTEELQNRLNELLGTPKTSPKYD